MKGIACDNKIRIEELQSLIELGTADDSLLQEDPRVKEAIRFSRYAILDMVISDEENDEICEYIARIVGDSFADTGIGLPKNIPQLDGTISNVSDIIYKGKFFFTGSFAVPKRVFGGEIEKRGGVIQKTVTSSTDYLVLASAGSEHYVTPNAGTKIKAAVKLREKHGRLSFINERTIESLL